MIRRMTRRLVQVLTQGAAFILLLLSVPLSVHGDTHEVASPPLLIGQVDTHQAPSSPPLIAHADTHPIPSIEDTLRPMRWQYLGPFSVAPREGITGIRDDPEVLLPKEDTHYPSILAQGGLVGWKAASPDSSGWVSVEFENVLWDTLMHVYGYAGIANGVYAYAEFDVSRAGRALVVAEKVGSFYLNGSLYFGDPYGHGFMRVPTLLKEGRNTVLVKIVGYGDHRFRFEIVPAPAAVILIDDTTVPDIIEGERGKAWLGITVANTTARTITGATLAVGEDRLIVRHERPLPDLAPLSVSKIPVEIDIRGSMGEGDRISLSVEIAYGTSAFTGSVDLRVRAKDQSFKRTFISRIDGSCQYYAVRPPADYDPAKKYALILTLHGANVEAHRQANSYRPKRDAFVVAPTNRRRYGFDWQDWGRLDALEVLEIAKSTLPVDTTRVYLTGHSMGGHGVWHVGLAHPDLFAAIAPGAGWTSFELYVPWFLGKASVFAEPGLRTMRDLVLGQDHPLRFVENALNLPVFILQGGSDDNVPPVHPRLFVRRLDDLGYSYRYKEVAGRSHWWTIDSLNVPCVDDPELIEFMLETRRNPHPHHVRFKTTNVAHSRRAYWLEITQQERLYQESEIEAQVEESLIGITTRNVRQFRVSVSRHLIPGRRATISVDGKRWHFDVGQGFDITFSKRGGEFRQDRYAVTGLFKSPHLYGPIKQAYFSPFVLVYGTAGDAETTRLLLHLARLEATQWWRRANGFAPVLPDSQVTGVIIENYNLVLFGGPDENLITGRIDRHLPIRLTAQGVTLGEKVVKGDTLAVKFVYPNPLNQEKLVVVHEGMNGHGTMLSTFFRTVYSGAGLPDFLIFDPRVRRLGWAGVMAAGFFDSRWELDERLMHYRLK